MKYEFYSMSTGGIANRLKTMVSLMRLAEKTESRFSFYWPKNKLCNINFCELFESPNKEISFEEAKNILRSKNKKYYLDGLNLFDFPGKKKVIFAGWRFIIGKNEKISLSKDMFFRNEKSLDYKFWKVPLKIRKEIQEGLKSFKPINPLKSKINFFEKKYTLHERVGIHMRRGDFKEAQEISPDDKFIIKIKQILKTNPKTKFFLCTDDKNSEKLLKKNFGNKIISYPKKNFDRLDEKFIQQGLIDLFLLSKTKEILGTYLSSFTELAWWIGGCKAKINIIMDEEAKKNMIKKRRKKKIIPFLKRKVYNLITPLYKRVLFSNT